MTAPLVHGTPEADRRLQEITARSIETSPELESRVRHIVEDVRQSGDRALLKYTEKFDGVTLTPGQLQVDPQAIQKAYNRSDPGLLEVLESAAANIRRFHEAQKRESWFVEDGDGVVLGKRITPLERVGILVPGASAPLFSTLLMAAIPAQVAGVDHLTLVTPPQPDGQVHPAVLAAAHIVGIDTVYRVFGAQAVAALAYGTESIERVDKLVGPGHPSVQIAKRLVYGQVDIDMIAGPSEIVVLADDSAEARHVAADMLSQAEHGSGYEAAVCITTSPELARSVSEEIDRQLPDLSHRNAAEQALARYGAIFVTSEISDGIDLVNRIAPEHVELIVDDPWSVQEGIRHAGAVFLGPASSEPVGDYFAGTNHILPTAGAARYASSVGVDTYCKDISVVAYTQERLSKVGGQIIALAEAEGLDGHANAIRLRLD